MVLARLAMVLIVLGGCSSYAWQKPGATAADFRVDDYACTKDARYPATKTIEEPYGGGVVGVAGAPRVLRPGESGGPQAPTIIYNSPPPPTRTTTVMEFDRALYSKCLESKGWFRQRVQ